MNSRITKYNPKYRDDNGVYIKNEWTSITDIGKSFDNVKLDLKKYLETENAYWNTVATLLKSCNIEKLIITDLEIHKDRIKDIPTELQEDSEINIVKSKNGNSYSVENIEIILRLALRELLWCKLVGESETYLHFGYDYYLYFGSDRLPDLETYVSESIIYVEPFKSPYL